MDDWRRGCIGVSMHTDDRNLCSRGMMCPRCENTRASKRAWNLCKRLENDLDMAEDEGSQLQVGVLTVTLPGKGSRIRRANLRSQYDYMTSRTTLPYHVGHHSMRGLNTKLKEWGVTGGCHNIEFTWSSKNKWWNTHCHSIIVGDKECMDVPLNETKSILWEHDRLLPTEKVTGGFSNRLQDLGFGRRYSLDWARPEEFAQTIRYAAKVAYMTKPIKAPAEKRAELRRFFGGFDGTNPRVSRPIGDWGRSFVPANPI